MSDVPENLQGPPAGRPFKITDPDELKISIQQYFDSCEPRIVEQIADAGINKEGKTIWGKREVMTKAIPPTVTGLARHLSVSRTTLLAYRKAEHYPDDMIDETRQAIMDTIENGIQQIEEFNERQLHKSGLANGIKFNLTNNFGWVDKQVIDNNNRTVEEELDDLERNDKADRDEVADAAAAELAAQDGDGNADGNSDEPAPAPTE